MDKKIISNENSIIAMLDKKGCFLSLSKLYKDLSGIDDSVIGKNHFDVFSNEEENRKAFESVVQTGVPHLIQSVGFNINGMSNRCGEVGNWILMPIFNEFLEVERVAVSYVNVNENNLKKSLKVDQDYLTLLLNRKGIHDKIDDLINKNNNFTVVFIDLNGFKSVNDTLGHNVGDKLLKAIGKRIKGCIRETDSIGRIGGDEFVLIIDSVKENVITSLLDRINDKFKREFIIDQNKIKSSASLGIARYPIDATSKEEIIALSDKNMYGNKKLKK